MEWRLPCDYFQGRSRMDVITLADMIRHYHSKVGKALEELEDCGHLMARIRELAEQGWDGPAANVFEEKMGDCSRYRKTAAETAERVRYILGQMAIEQDV